MSNKLTTSANGIAMIKRWEGKYLNAYKDCVGIWTVGYGMIESDYSVTGIHVHAGTTITNKQCEETLPILLKKKYEPKVNKYMDKYNFNQNQFDALVSFCYNIGNIDQLTANGTRSIETISKKMLEYNKADGKVVNGLTNRRKDERKLFDTPVDKKSGTTSSSSKTTKIKRAYSGKLHNPSTSFKRGYAKKGDTGAYIGEYQGFLKWYYDIKIKNFVDSDFGSNTEKYVKKFQKDMKIKADGLIGKDIYNKMKSVKK